MLASCRAAAPQELVGAQAGARDPRDRARARSSSVRRPSMPVAPRTSSSSGGCSSVIILIPGPVEDRAAAIGAVRCALPDLVGAHRLLTGAQNLEQAIEVGEQVGPQLDHRARVAPPVCARRAARGRAKAPGASSSAETTLGASSRWRPRARGWRAGALSRPTLGKRHRPARR